MSSTFTIQLNNLRFFSEHGLFAEEAKVGNEFEVNVSLSIQAPKTEEISIDKTINYAEVYRIIKEVLSVRKDLLEELAMEIADKVKQQFPMLNKAAIQIIKLNPPITSFAGSVSVTYDTSFDD